MAVRTSPRAAFLKVLLVLGLVAVGAAPGALAQADSSDSTPDPAAADVPEFSLDEVDGLSCPELEQVFYERIPRFVYDDQPDQLYELVVYASDQCDLGEPLGRTRILASIWDGNFSEAIYGFGVLGWLADRYDPARQPEAGTARADFDTFTTDFASQMLPHTPEGSLERFFCLYYSGLPDAAWEMLQDDALDNTWLRYYYDDDIDRLERQGPPHMFGVYAGTWRPGGDQEIVGPRGLFGMSVEQWWQGWFMRLAVEVRGGRSDEPYYVVEGNVSGYSDRWNATLLALEGGLGLWRSGPHLAELFAGVGYDGVKPFKDEKVTIAGVNFSVGLGYRYHPSRSQRWYVRADGRYEYVSDRNGGGTPLGGSAWSVRAGIGFAVGSDPEPRLRALGRKP